SSAAGAVVSLQSQHGHAYGPRPSLSGVAGQAGAQSGSDHERGAPQGGQALPRRADDLRSRRDRQAGHQLRLAGSGGRGDLRVRQGTGPPGSSRGGWGHAQDHSAWVPAPILSNVTALERVLLTTPSGNAVLMKNVASLKLNPGPVKIDRKYFQRVVHVTANPVDRDLGSTAEELGAKFARLRLPEGFSIRLAGQIQQQQEAFENLLYLALPLALILVYMVMAAQ